MAAVSVNQINVNLDDDDEIDVLSFSAYCGLVAAYSPLTYDPNVKPIGKEHSERASSVKGKGANLSTWSLFVEKECAYVTFRGSTTMDDWLVDLSATPAMVKTSDPQKVIYVHGGCKNVIENEFDNILFELRKLGTKAKTVCSTGHSLGAALAQVFATIYAFLPPDQQPLPLRSKIYTFAGPMALWIDNVIDNSDLLDSKFHCVNFVNNNDVVPRLLCRSTPAIISYLLKNLTGKNAFLNGLVSLITPAIEDKVEEFKIVSGFSPLAIYSELLVPYFEPKVVTYTREASQPSPYDVIIGKSIMGLNIDDHNTARYFNNLSLCGKINEVTKKWANTFTIKLAGMELYLSASNGRDIALSDTVQDKWELLPDSGNVIRHVNTGKFLGISSTFLDSQVRLTVQNQAISWTVVSRYNGTFECKSGVLAVSRVFGDVVKGDLLCLAYQALASTASSKWSVTNTVRLEE
eukprot:gene25616-34183_t